MRKHLAALIGAFMLLPAPAGAVSVQQFLDSLGGGSGSGGSVSEVLVADEATLESCLSTCPASGETKFCSLDPSTEWMVDGILWDQPACGQEHGIYLDLNGSVVYGNNATMTNNATLFIDADDADHDAKFGIRGPGSIRGSTTDNDARVVHYNMEPTSGLGTTTHTFWIWDNVHLGESGADREVLYIDGTWTPHWNISGNNWFQKDDGATSTNAVVSYAVDTSAGACVPFTNCDPLPRFRLEETLIQGNGEALCVEFDTEVVEDWGAGDLSNPTSTFLSLNDSAFTGCEGYEGNIPNVIAKPIRVRRGGDSAGLDEIFRFTEGTVSADIDVQILAWDPANGTGPAVEWSNSAGNFRSLVLTLNDQEGTYATGGRIMLNQFAGGHDWPTYTELNFQTQAQDWQLSNANLPADFASSTVIVNGKKWRTVLPSGTSHTLEEGEAYGNRINTGASTGTYTVTLPRVREGMSLRIEQGGAHQVIVVPAAGDFLLATGPVGGVGAPVTDLRSPSSNGQSCSLELAGRNLLWYPMLASCTWIVTP